MGKKRSGYYLKKLEYMLLEKNRDMEWGGNIEMDVIVFLGFGFIGWFVRFGILFCNFVLYFIYNWIYFNILNII